MNRRLLLAFASSLALAVLLWYFPLFHVVPMRYTQRGNTVLDRGALTYTFWKDKLLPAAEHSASVSELWEALARDPAAARKQFGHSPGMSSVAYFLVQGSGKVSKAGKDVVELTLDATNLPMAELSTGPIFGNAIRDCTGLLNGSDFPNSQDFNDISTELNHIVETKVIPTLRERATAGKTVQFAGCIELEEGDLPKIPRVIPINVTVE